MTDNDYRIEDRLETARKAGHPNYALRRLKFAIAVIGFISSATLLFTWRATDRPMAWLVAGIYMLTGLWLIIRFAPRDDDCDGSIR